MRGKNTRKKSRGSRKRKYSSKKSRGSGKRKHSSKKAKCCSGKPREKRSHKKKKTPPSRFSLSLSLSSDEDAASKSSEGKENLKMRKSIQIMEEKAAKRQVPKKTNTRRKKIKDKAPKPNKHMRGHVMRPDAYDPDTGLLFVDEELIPKKSNKKSNKKST